MTSPWLQGGGVVGGGQAGGAYPFTPGGGWGPAQERHTEHCLTLHHRLTRTGGRGGSGCGGGDGRRTGWRLVALGRLVRPGPRRAQRRDDVA